MFQWILLCGPQDFCLPEATSKLGPLRSQGKPSFKVVLDKFYTGTSKTKYIYLYAQRVTVTFGREQNPKKAIL